MQWPEAAAGSSRTGTISCARLPREHIAHTPYSLDQRAVSELRRLEFPPQVTDVHVDGPVKGCGGSFVEGIHQLIARKDASGGFHQLLKDVEFKSSQLDRDALPSHFTRAGVELDILHAQYALRRRGTSRPSNPGSITSSTTKSTEGSSAASSPSGPVCAACTSNPCPRRY